MLTEGISITKYGLPWTKVDLRLISSLWVSTNLAKTSSVGWYGHELRKVDGYVGGRL